MKKALTLMAIVVALLASGASAAKTKDPLVAVLGKPQAVTTTVDKTGNIYTCRTWSFIFKKTRVIANQVVQCVYIGRQTKPATSVPKTTTAKKSSSLAA